jgi:hypothetical protein
MPANSNTVHSSSSAAALKLLEQMLDTPSGTNFGPKDVPAPALSTYNIITRGFCVMGGPASAVSWFEQLLDQGKHTKND